MKKSGILLQISGQPICRAVPSLDKTKDNMKMKTIIPALLLAILPGTAGAVTLTLQQCRDSAIANNSGLKIARQKIEIAGYDRKIALANYFPDISASGAYMYNSRNLNLLT